jgi:hypothetical protein
MEVNLPDEPMLINGSPYAFELDAERLSLAIRDARASTARWRKGEVTGLDISLGDSLPSHIADPDSSPEQASIFDVNEQTIAVVLPSEIVQSQSDTGVLAQQVELSLNHDIQRGMNEARYLRKGMSWRRFRFFSVATLGGAFGEGAGILTSPDTALAIAGRGTAGAVVGAAAGVLAYTLGNVAWEEIHGEDPRYLMPRAMKKAEGHTPNQAEEAVFAEPVVAVVPAEA